MRFLISSILFSLTSLPALAAGPDYSDVDLRAWVRVHETRAGAYEENGIEGEYVSDNEVLVTKGGALFANTSARSGPADPSIEFETVVLRGLGTRGERNDLAAAVAQAQLGAQGDCTLAGDPRIPALYEITWYGRSPRRHSFKARTVDTAVEPATCPARVERFLSAMTFFQIRVRAHADTEVLSSQ